MREAQFLKQRANDWKALENMLLHQVNHDADDLARAFTQLTDDLAYAQTYYPNSKTTTYLNQLSTKVHRMIYKNRREDKGRFGRFMKYDAPEAVYRAHPQLRTALIVFLLAVGVGVLSTIYDSQFPRMFFGDNYINMTIENIKKGDPMGVYKHENQLDMFAAITFNNAMVGLRAFVFGIFSAIGTGIFLIQNGIMLGTFFTFLYKEGVIREALMTVWIHGTIEISVIVIAGGAGLVLGRSLLFPGTYPRKESFIRGFKEGLKIVLSTIPFFVVAGFLESFVTRYTEMPEWLSLIIILGSLALIVWYYIIYPIQLFKPKALTTGIVELVT